MRHLTKKQLEEAIKKTRGIKTAICQMLAMDYRTLQGFIERWNMQELDPKYCQVIIDRMKKLNPEIEVKKI